MAAKRNSTSGESAKVPWAKLATAKGKALKVPSHLRALREKSGQDAASGALASLLADEG